jgi:serine/threonine protein kinase
MFANKIQHKGRMKEAKAMDLALEERSALIATNSDFVVGLQYAFQDKENVYLILELLSGGDLQFHLNKEKKFSEDVARYFIASTLQGIGAVHDAGLVYRDLKPENILLSSEGYVKITDLGLATTVGDGITGSAGTPGFYAPEMLTKGKDGQRQVYHQVVDFWSLGCVVFAFFDGASPFWKCLRHKEGGGGGCD